MAQSQKELLESGELKSGQVILPTVLMDLLDSEAGESSIKVSRSRLLEFILTERYARQLEGKGCRLEPVPHFKLQVIAPAEATAAL
jgi:hypothetical protein